MDPSFKVLVISLDLDHAFLFAAVLGLIDYRDLLAEALRDLHGGLEDVLTAVGMSATAYL